MIELPLAADLHAGDSLVPAGDHPALAEGELERHASVDARVELRSVGEPAGVVDDHGLPGRRARDRSRPRDPRTAGRTAWSSPGRPWWGSGRGGLRRGRRLRRGWGVWRSLRLRRLVRCLLGGGGGRRLVLGGLFTVEAAFWCAHPPAASMAASPTATQSIRASIFTMSPPPVPCLLVPRSPSRTEGPGNRSCQSCAVGSLIPARRSPPDRLPLGASQRKWK